jgi:hypothetical protein
MDYSIIKETFQMIENFRLYGFNYIGRENISRDTSRLKLQIDTDILNYYLSLEKANDWKEIRKNQFIASGISYDALQTFSEYFPYLFILTNDLPELDSRDIQMEPYLLKKHKHIYITGGYGDDYLFYMNKKSFYKKEVKNLIIKSTNTSFTDFTSEFIRQGPEPVSYRFMFSLNNIDLDTVGNIFEKAENELMCIEEILTNIDLIVYTIGHEIYCFETKNKRIEKMLQKNHK